VSVMKKEKYKLIRRQKQRLALMWGIIKTGCNDSTAMIATDNYTLYTVEPETK